MHLRYVRLAIAAVFAAVLITGCGALAPAVPPTFTPLPATPTDGGQADTPVPPTATNTPIPPTATPEPVIYLQGTLAFSGAKQDPFSTKLVLHDAAEYKTAWKSQSGADGTYTFGDVAPGTYNLWIQMSTGLKPVPGCSDVATPGKGWTTGIYLSETTVLTLDKGLSLLEAINLKGFSGVTRIDFISPAITLEDGKVVEFNVDLKCKA